MPIIKSAIKRARQAEVRRSRNLVTKRAIRTDVRAADDALAAGNVKDIAAALSAVASELDRAVKKGVVHKNTAARHKSRLAKRAAAASAETKPAAAETGSAPKAPKAVTKKPAAKKPAAKKSAK